MPWATHSRVSRSIHRAAAWSRSCTRPHPWQVQTRTFSPRRGPTRRQSGQHPVATVDEVEFEPFKGDQSGPCSICGRSTSGAWLDDRQIDCGYGSNHDGNHYRWLRPRDAEREPEGLVCDGCIGALIADGAVEFSHEDMPGLPEEGPGLDEKRKALEN